MASRRVRRRTNRKTEAEQRDDWSGAIAALCYRIAHAVTDPLPLSKHELKVLKGYYGAYNALGLEPHSKVLATLTKHGIEIPAIGSRAVTALLQPVPDRKTA